MMNLSKGLGIRQLVAPYHLATLIVFLLHSTIDVLTIRSTRVSPVFTFGGDIVVAESTLELQVLDEFILTIYGIESTSYILSLTIIGIGESWVTVANTDEGTVPCAILIIDWVGWSHGTSRRIEWHPWSTCW